jgi:plasmid stability protein
MDKTIRNVDETVFRKAKAQAAIHGKTVGEFLSEALKSYLNRLDLPPKRRSLKELVPERYGASNRKLSEEVDAVVYRGERR